MRFLKRVFSFGKSNEHSALIRLNIHVTIDLNTAKPVLSSHSDSKKTNYGFFGPQTL